MKTATILKNPLVLSMLMVALAPILATPLLSATNNYGKSKKPKIVAVFFYSEDSEDCKILEPKLETVKERSYSDGEVIFKKLDTSKKEEAAGLATQLGITSLFEKYGTKSGFVILTDKKTGEKVGPFITFPFTELEIEKAINEALEEI